MGSTHGHDKNIYFMILGTYEYFFILHVVIKFLSVNSFLINEN